MVMSNKQQKTDPKTPNTCNDVKFDKVNKKNNTM